MVLNLYTALIYTFLKFQWELFEWRNYSKLNDLNVKFQQQILSLLIYLFITWKGNNLTLNLYSYFMIHISDIFHPSTSPPRHRQKMVKQLNALVTNCQEAKQQPNASRQSGRVMGLNWKITQQHQLSNFQQ